MPRAPSHALRAGVQDRPGLPAAATQALTKTLTRHKSQLEVLLHKMGALGEPPSAQTLHASVAAAPAGLHQQQGGHASQHLSKIQRVGSHADAAALHQQLQEHHQHLHHSHQQLQLDEQPQDLAGSAPREAPAGPSFEAGQQDELGGRPALPSAAGQLLSSRGTTGQLQATRRVAWSPSAAAGSGSGSHGDTPQDIVPSMHGSQRRPVQPGMRRGRQDLSDPRFKTGG